MVAVPIPFKQPNNWGKEVSSAIKAVCRLDRCWLTPHDYARYFLSNIVCSCSNHVQIYLCSVSRFITRASAEKQLALSAEPATQLFCFLLEYIESQGRICNASIWPQEEGGAGAQMIQQSVMHELVRAFAQLLADCGQHLDARSQQTLSVLLPLCDHRYTLLLIFMMFLVIINALSFHN